MPSNYLKISVCLLAILAIAGAAPAAPAAYGTDGYGAPGDNIGRVGMSAAAAPAGPLGPPPPLEEGSWFNVPLYGGVVNALAVVPGERGGQTLVAGGLELFMTGRADGWRQAPTVRGPIVNVESGANVIYVTGPEGSQMSRNWGRGWSGVRVRSRDEVRFVAVSPNHPLDGQALAVTVEDWRLYRDDQGSTDWTEVIVEFEGEHQIGGAAFSPAYAADETLFVGTEAGIFSSTDTGQRWFKVSDESAPMFGPEGGDIDNQGLVISPEYGDDPERIGDPDNKTFWAYNNQGVFRSDDGAETWEQLPLEAGLIWDLAVNPAYPQDRTIAAAIEDSSGAVAAISHDGGDTWTKVPGHHGIRGTAIEFAVDYALGIPGRPTNAVYMPALLKRGLPGEPTNVKPFVGSSQIYLATNGDGVWRSKDAGATWQSVSNGLSSVTATSLGFLAGGPDAPVLAGTRASGLYRSVDGGRSYDWVDTDLPMGADAAAHEIEVSPAFESDSTAFLAADTGVWRSRDAGLTWSRLAGAPESAIEVALSPNYGSDRTVIVPGAISRDGGDTWSEMPATAPATALAFGVDYPQTPTIWMGTDTSVLFSTDDGENFEEHRSSSLRNRVVHDIAVVEVPQTADPVRIFVAHSRGVSASNDNGETFNTVSGFSGATTEVVYATFSNPVGAVVAAAGENGVSLSTNRGIDWDRYRGPENSLSLAISSGGSVVIAGGAQITARYGLASGRAYIPQAETP